MSERSFTRASWASFVAVTGVLALAASCSGGSGESDTGAGTESTPAPPAAATSAPETTSPSATTTPQEESAGQAAFIPPADNPDELAAWNQLDVIGGDLVLAAGVTPYALNTPLFSDHAHKLRTVWMPDGAGPAGFQTDTAFDFPVGTVVTKTFYYPEPDGAAPADGLVIATEAPTETPSSLDLDAVRLVETRVLVHRDDGWHALPYVWDADETVATLRRTGEIVRLTTVDGDVETPLTYVVPDVNQCANCHATNHSTGKIQTIGLQARHLNLDVDLGNGSGSQLDQWQELGLLGDAPLAAEIPAAAVWNDDSVAIEDRARAYLDINCAHCHNPTGAADTSGLYLDHQTDVGFTYGICKPPVAAGGGTGGRLVDISPGEPDESIMIYRMESVEPDEMMPELGRTTGHAAGVDVVAEWIASLDGDC